MEDYIIYAGKMEHWQMVQDTDAIDLVFERARKAIVGGVDVILMRETAYAAPERFDTITNLQDLDEYRNKIYRFITK